MRSMHPPKLGVNETNTSFLQSANDKVPPFRESGLSYRFMRANERKHGSSVTKYSWKSLLNEMEQKRMQEAVSATIQYLEMNERDKQAYEERMAEVIATRNLIVDDSLKTVGMVKVEDGTSITNHPGYVAALTLSGSIVIGKNPAPGGSRTLHRQKLPLPSTFFPEETPKPKELTTTLTVLQEGERVRTAGRFNTSPALSVWTLPEGSELNVGTTLDTIAQMYARETSRICERDLAAYHERNGTQLQVG